MSSLQSAERKIVSFVSYQVLYFIYLGGLNVISPKSDSVWMEVVKTEQKVGKGAEAGPRRVLVIA